MPGGPGVLLGRSYLVTEVVFYCAGLFFIRAGVFFIPIGLFLRFFIMWCWGPKQIGRQTGHIDRLASEEQEWVYLRLFEAILDQFGVILDLCWVTSGLTWAIWDSLEPFWGHLGTFVGPTWGYLGLLEAILGASWDQELPRHPPDGFDCGGARWFGWFWN